MSILFCGLVMKPYVEANVSRKSHTTIKYFLKLLSSSCDAIIFMFLGESLVQLTHEFNFAFVLFTLVFCTLFRAVGIVVLTRLANHFGRLEKVRHIRVFMRTAHHKGVDSRFHELFFSFLRHQGRKNRFHDSNKIDYIIILKREENMCSVQFCFLHPSGEESGTIYNGIWRSSGSCSILFGHRSSSWWLCWEGHRRMSTEKVTYLVIFSSKNLISNWEDLSRKGG